MSRVFMHVGRPSRGGRDLARELGILRLRINSSRYRPREGDLIINWGGRPTYPVEYLNNPMAVGLASDKLRSLTVLSQNGVPVVPFTTSQAEAREWRETGSFVYSRTLLNASEGRGIVVTGPFEGEDVPYAPLYTKYIGRNTEYRVHVFREEVIDFAQKKKRRGEEADQMVKSHSNGWIFAREEVVILTEALEASIQAVSVLGLDFGAVDVLAGSNGSVYVLEVNTAPGLEGTTLRRYAEAFRGYLSE